MIRLLFVDDQPLTLKSLEYCFQDKTRFEIVGCLQQAELAELWCERMRPDAVFLDIQTGEANTNGLLVAASLKKKFPALKILLMTGFDEVSYLPRAREIGVDAFLSKSEPPQTFISALQQVLAGAQVFPEENQQIPVLHGELPLTARELEILRLICEDLSNREIAEQLYISVNTVNHHVKNLFRKTGKSGRPGLIAYAIAGGWINPNI